jgi:hypothetical protein
VLRRYILVEGMNIGMVARCRDKLSNKYSVDFLLRNATYNDGFKVNIQKKQEYIKNE